MIITEQFLLHKSNLQTSVDESLKTVISLKETVMKIQRYDLAAEFRKMEKQLEKMKNELSKIEWRGSE